MSASCAHGRRSAAPLQAVRSSETDGLLLAQLAPALLADLDAVLLGGALDAAPRRVALVVADAFDLVEPGDRVAHMAGVVQRLLALLGKSELVLVQRVAMLGVEFGHGDLLSPPKLTTAGFAS